MLATNLIAMKQQLKQLSALSVQPADMEQNPKSPFWEAAKTAYYETIKPNIPDADDPDFQDNVIQARIDAENDANKSANKFAYYFCKILNDNKIWDTIANEIDGHVKAMEPMINLIVPTHGALVCPTGPVTGTLVGTTKNGGIQII